MPSPILARADALMQRRRQSPGETDDIPVLTDSIASPDDDIPLLTDFEPPCAEMPPNTNVAANVLLAEETTARQPQEPQPAPAPPIPEQLLTELARRVEQRLIAEIPRLVASTLRDLLAEKGMIDALPPQD